MRVTVDEVWVQTDDFEQLLHTFLLFLAATTDLVDFQRLAYDAAHSHAWI